MATDPLWLPSLSYDEAELRKMDSILVMPDGTALGSRAGVRPGDPGLTVTLSGSTINVSTGVATVTRAGQGLYRAYLPATSPGSVAAAHATFDRIDLVYLRVWDTSVDASGLRKADAVYLQGTASGSPVAPSPGGTEIYVPLATISVPHSGSGSPSVSTAVRPYTVAPGGILPTTSAAEPSSGGPGQVFYDTDTDTFKYFQANGTTKAALLDSSGGSQVGKLLFARKTADQSVTGSATYVDDTHLTFTVVAGAVYEVEGLLIFQADPAGDIKVEFVAPSGTFSWIMAAQAGGATVTVGELITDVQNLASTNYVMGGVGAGTSLSGHLRGLLVVGGTGGTFKCQWAQSSPLATATVMKTDSYIKLTRMA